MRCRRIWLIGWLLIVWRCEAAVDYGPTLPIAGKTAADCFGPLGVNFIADENNICWFHQCVPAGGLVAKRCALGTHLPMGYVAQSYNPCIAWFNIQGSYDCTRDKSAGGPSLPACFTTYFSDGYCKNGGKPQYQGNICWCDCPQEFQGAPDCGKRVGTTPPSVVNASQPCADGRPLDAWCTKAGAGVCRNGGTCRDQCTDLVCDCPPPFTRSKFCDQFDCSDGLNPCRNGGTCQRGAASRDEFATCACAPNFTGQFCQTVLP